MRNDPDAVGHYTAYISISDYWLQFDDLSPKSSSYRLKGDCPIYPQELLRLRIIIKP